MIDLHQHSIFSDGTDSVEELINANKEKNIKTMSLTDHDTIQGCKEILKLNTNIGLNFIPGVEFSTEDNGESVHLLAYGFNVKDKIINKLLNKSMKLRLKRIKKRIKLLKSEFNITLTDQELDIINKSNNPNKVLLAHILINKNLASSVSEAIKKYLYHKMSDQKYSSIYIISKLKKSSALVSFAHGLGGVGEKRVDKKVFEERLSRFKQAGLSALECHYSLYSSQEQKYLLKKAKEYNLLVSGGSDYHGINKDVSIGELSCDGSKIPLKNLTIIDHVKNVYKI